MSQINKLLESSREKRERFAAHLRSQNPGELTGDDELLTIWSSWSAMDEEITTLKSREQKLVSALKFYGKTTHLEEINTSFYVAEDDFELHSGNHEHGKRARQVLSELGVE